MPSVKDVGEGAVVPEVLLTRSEVARILGVAPTTVTRWAREGRLACRLTLGGHHRYSSRLIEEISARLSRSVSRTAGSSASKQLWEVKS